MSPGNTEDSIQELARVDVDACVTRANRVRNAMALAIRVLEGAESSPEMRDEKRRLIDAAFKALAGYDVPTEKRLQLLAALDEVSAVPDSPRLPVDAARPAIPIHTAVLDLLPAQLAVQFSSFEDELRDIVLAWRVKTPGRRKGHAAKWVKLAKMWESATGERISPEAWKQTAKKAAKAAKRRTRATRGPLKG